MTISEQIRRIVDEGVAAQRDKSVSAYVRATLRHAVSPGTVHVWRRDGYRMQSYTADAIADALGYEWVLIPKDEVKE